MVHYLAIRSAFEVNRPDSLRLWYRHEPQGEWWERARRYVEPVLVEPPAEVFGNPLLHPAHQCDVLRLRILREHGGIYLDADVLCLRPFTDLLRHHMVMGEETGGGLCNAVLLAERGSPFLARWLEEYRWFRSKGEDAYWPEHSVIVPARLARQHPNEIHVLNGQRFFWPMFWTRHLEVFFGGPGQPEFCGESYCTHLWEQITWTPYLRDLTPDRIRTGQDEFSRLARRFLD